MTAKKLSIIAYITILGWGYAYVKFGTTDRPPLVQYHLKQALGIFMGWTVFGVLVALIHLFSPFGMVVLAWGSLLWFILLGMGMINALNEATRPIPFIGAFFENKFSFI